MAEIIKINEDTYRIEDGMVRFFVLLGKEKALVIDTGMTTANAREIVEGITKLPLELLNTHADGDHTGGNAGFEWFYMSPQDEERLHSKGRTGKIVPVKTGDIIELGERTLEVIDLPGHTPGSIAVLDYKNRVLISGDSIQDGNIYMFGEGRNLEQYIESFKNLEPYKDKFDTIYPSHGNFPVYPSLIPKLIECAKKILNGEAEGQEVDLWGNKAFLYKFDCAGFFGEVPKE